MSFILSQPQNEISAILLSYKKGLKKPFRYSIGQSIIVAHWDKINQRAIISAIFLSDFFIRNSNLSNLSSISGMLLNVTKCLNVILLCFFLLLM